MGKILAIDDDADIRDFLALVLEGAGHRVVAAADDGEAGLALAAAESPDLILMDLSMPRMTGFEAVRHLRDGHKSRSIPVIALSAHDSAGDYEEAPEAGCESFLAPPVDSGLLVQRVAEVLVRRG